MSAPGRTIACSARYIEEGANGVVDGRRVAGSVNCASGVLPSCTLLSPVVVVQLESIPRPDGIYFLPVRNPEGGLFSNDFIFRTVPEPTSALLQEAALLTRGG